MNKDEYVVFIGEPCVDEYYEIIDAWPREGNKFITRYEKSSSGGMIANAACVMAGYGMKTYSFCQLYKDEHYDFLIDDLQQYHIDTSHIISLENGRNGKCEIFTHEGERTINVVQSTPKSPYPYQEALPFLLQASCVYCSLSTTQMFDQPLSLLKELKENNVRIIFDNESSCYRDDWKDYTQYAYLLSFNDYAIDLYSQHEGEEALRKTVFDLDVPLLA